MAKKTNSAAVRGILSVAALALTPLLAAPQAAAEMNKWEAPGRPETRGSNGVEAAQQGPETLGPPSGLVTEQIGFGAPTGQPHGVLVDGAPYSQSAASMPGYSYSTMPGYSYPAMQGYSYPYMSGYSYPSMQGYSYPSMTGYSYPYASGYQGGTVVWVPMMMPAAPGEAKRGGQSAPASTPAPTPNTAPGAGGAGRPQPVLCMLAPKVRSATTPSRIAVIANTETECAAIGGSATQAAAIK